jgi:hypothetical protein
MSELILPESVKKWREENKAAIQVDTVVVTSIDVLKGVAIQDTYAILEENVIDHIEEIVATKDKALNDALIKLGWTPPTIN